MIRRLLFFLFFFFNDTATTEIYTLSLHDALPIYKVHAGCAAAQSNQSGIQSHLIKVVQVQVPIAQDRKSTRLNSSHLVISYAVFCLKKKKIHIIQDLTMHTFLIRSPST